MEIIEIFPELGLTGGSFDEYNKKTLFRILSDNSDTEYGRLHGFGTAADEAEYRSRVKVEGYEAFKPYIDRMSRGEKNLLFSYDQYCLLETSGSTDEGKLIPITREALSRYGSAMDRYLERNVEGSGGRRFFISFLQSDLSKQLSPCDTLLFTASYYRYLLEAGILPPDSLAGGKALNFFTGTCDYLYAKLWMAFAFDDLVSLEVVYLYDLVVFFHYMESSYERILSDMEKKSIPETVNLPGDIKEALLSLELSRDRLDRIKRECDAGFEGIAGRLWSRIKLVSGIGSKAFIMDEISVKKYIGNLPVWHYIYAASECLMGVPREPDSYDFVLFPGSAYYEFRKADETGGEIVDLPSLVPGERYEPILTTFSGLYRYPMGDILKITGFFGDIPVFRFEYRKNLVMNIAGEKLDMKTMDRAVLNWSRQSNIPVWQYYFYEDYSDVPACYHIIIAPESGEYYDTGKASLEMDMALRGLSWEYDDLRSLNSISSLKLSFVDKERFLELKGEKIKKGQPKPVNIIK